MRVLVTGGAGYVGFSLVRALAARSDVDQVVVIDNLARGNNALFVSGGHGPAPVSFQRVDILDGYGVSAVLRSERIDTVFHLAAHATTPQSDIGHHVFDQVNNWGTAQIARSIDESDVERVVYLSSFAVYGDAAQPVDESTIPQPTSSYGVSKLAAEEHVWRLAAGGRTVHLVRAGNVHGFNPAIRFDAVVNAMAFDAWTERRIRVHGDGSQTRPFIAVDVLAAAVVDLVSSRAPSGRWNLATESASINKLAEMLHRLVPGLEQLNLHRDARMQQIAMQTPVAVSKYLELPDRSLEDSIEGLIRALQG